MRTRAQYFSEGWLSRMFLWLTALLAALLASDISISAAAVTENTTRPYWKSPGCHIVGLSKEIKMPSCLPFLASMNGCRGYCDSWTFPSPKEWTSVRQEVTSEATCCSIVDTEPITFKVPCIGGEREITILSAVSCKCDVCHHN